MELESREYWSLNDYITDLHDHHFLLVTFTVTENGIGLHT